jgi:hypothetical protein
VLSFGRDTGDKEVSVTVEKGRRSERGRRKVGCPKGEGNAPEMTKNPECERRFVDIDPWAVLLEQLMEVPDEGPSAGKGNKRK